MEMSEEIYANAEVTEDNRADSSDSENSYEDIFVNQDYLETQGPRIFKQSECSGGDTTWGRCCRLTVLCVVLLCVLLLSSITVLWIKNNTLTKERDQLQTSYNTMTIERDQLQTSYNTLTKERDQLQTSYKTLTIERDQLQTSYNTLTKERDQLLTSYNTMTIERDQLQTSYNTLTKERDQLQTSYNTLTKERDQLQTSYNTLTKERDQLLTSYNTMTIERDQFQMERDGYLRTLFDKVRYFSSSLYFMSNGTKNWAESRQDCRNNGADLVIINSREEQVFISELMGRRRAWIGLSDRDREGKWKWVDDTPLSTGFWGSGEPNSKAGDEDCVVNAPSFNWADYLCNYTFMWICEKTIFN